MAKKRATATGDKLFVRGPDGSLYILSKSKDPYKLNEKEAATVGRILRDAQKQVGEQLKNQLPVFGSMVNINIPPFPFK